MREGQGRKPSRARLVLALASGAGTVFPLILKETLVGRIDSAHLLLDDQTVSRLHARFSLEKDRVLVEDLDSREGTWVNGVLVKSHLLADGDQVAFGDVCAVVHIDGGK
jgi:pSer/pThr/pTyr-binding forkhead associated (FHA) protein